MMENVIAYIKEKQKEYHVGTPAYNVLRHLETVLPDLFFSSQPSEQKPTEKDVSSGALGGTIKPTSALTAEEWRNCAENWKQVALSMQEAKKQERQKAIQECIKKIDIDDREIRQAAEDRLNPYPSSPMDEFKRGMKEMRAIGVTELKKLKQK